MPTPRRIQRQVEATNLPNVRVGADPSLEAFGGGASLDRMERAAAGLTNTVVQIADEERRKANDTFTTELYAKMTAEQNRLMWDPKEGAMAKRGRDAFGAPDDFASKFDKFADELEKTASNEEQRIAARNMRTKQKQEGIASLQRHVFQEAKQFDDDTTESALSVEHEKAVLNFRDPEAVKNSIGMQELLITENARRNGKPPEWVQLKVQTARSKTASSIVNRMLSNGDDLAAKSYFETNRDLFAGNDVAQVEKALEEGSLRGESQRQSDLIVKGAAKLGDALAQAKQIQDPKLRDAVVDRVRGEFQLRDAAERDAQEKMFLNATNIIEKTGDFDAIPVTDVAKMPLTMRSALKSYANHKREGTQPATDWQSYYELKSIASADATREQFVKMNLMEYRGRLADSEFKQMVDLQTSLRKGDSKAEQMLKGYRTEAQIVADTLKAAGVDDAEKVSRFHRAVDDEMVQMQERTGKKAGPKEVQEIVDNLMVKGITDRGLIWDTKKAVYELEPGEEFEVELDEVPRADRERIEAALKRRNLPVTPQSIVGLYAARLKKLVPSAN